MGRRDRILLENILITGVAAEGKAIAHSDGKVLFVPHGVPGDCVDVQVTHRKKAYLEGYITRMRKPSELRQEPFCSHYGVCGGCKWQALPYPLQLQYKQQQVEDQLLRIGKLTLPVIEQILPSEKTQEYRNKLEFTFSNKAWLSTEEMDVLRQESLEEDMAPQNALGFHVGGFFDKVLDVKHCYLQRAPSNAIRLEIKAFAQEQGYTFFDLRAQTGFLRTLMIRTTSIGETMVVLAFAYEDKALRETLLTHLQAKFPEITALMYVINSKRNDTFDGLDIISYHGPGFICEQMESLKFKIGPKSFYQTNSEQAYRLYSVVRELAALTGKERVYDLYTGTGTIALFLAGQAKEVIGIEYVVDAIENAQENAQNNSITNSRFYAGDMKEVLTSEFIAVHGAPDVLIVDPPRAGMHPKVVQTILEAAPEKLIYVSCNPATQARDLNMLSLNYEIQVVRPVDMFPHTHHVENVVLAVRKS